MYNVWKEKKMFEFIFKAFKPILCRDAEDEEFLKTSIKYGLPAGLLVGCMTADIRAYFLYLVICAFLFMAPAFIHRALLD